jgi:hypothetical protein
MKTTNFRRANTRSPAKFDFNLLGKRNENMQRVSFLGRTLSLKSVVSKIKSDFADAENSDELTPTMFFA